MALRFILKFGTLNTVPVALLSMVGTFPDQAVFGEMNLLTNVVVFNHIITPKSKT